MARPRLNIDPAQVEKLAALNLSTAEMAAVMDCDKRTLERRFAAVIEKGREKGKSSLKRKQYEVAMSGNVSMLIWLGKQMLGQSDKQDIHSVTEHKQPAPEFVKQVIEEEAKREEWTH